MADPTSLGVIDDFVVTFTQYIDSGFGLLGGEVQYLTAILIGIDITLSGTLLGHGTGQFRHRKIPQKGHVCRRLCAHHYEFLQPGQYRLRQFWRFRTEGYRDDTDR